MANKAYKFRIYPNKEQENMFVKTFGCVRFIYNRMLADKIEYYKETKQKLNNTPAQYKKEFEWLKEVDSMALCNAQMNLQTAYNNFFRSPKVGFPKFKSKKRNKNSYTTNNQNGTVSIIEDKLKLPKIGLVKIKQHRMIPDNQKIKSATITRIPSGKYYVSILVEYEQNIPDIKLDKMCRFCGAINKELTLADRVWTCECGKTLNRDENAAINIMNVGLSMV